MEVGVGVDEKGDGLLRLESLVMVERIRLVCCDFIVERVRVEVREGEKSFFIVI